MSLRQILSVVLAPLGLASAPAADLSKFDDVKNSGRPLEFAVDDVDKDRLSHPYVFHSLKDATREQLFAWAGGKTLSDLARELAVDIVVPPGLWSAPPDDALRDLVEANRSGTVRKNYPLKIAAPAAPFPKSGVVTFSAGTSGCYDSASLVWSLRWSPERSWLVYAEESFPGADAQPAFSSRAAYDLRYLELPPADALQFAQLIAALPRCSSGQPEHGSPNAPAHSTADSFATLDFAPDETVGAFHWHEMVSAVDTMRDYCQGKWDLPMALNFADRLFVWVLPAHLGASWSRLELQDWGKIPVAARWRIPASDRFEAALHARTARLLDLAADPQNHLDLEITSTAIAAAGTHLLTDLEPQLAAIEKALPPKGESEHRLDELDRQIAKLEKEQGEGASERSYLLRKYPPVESSKLLPDAPAPGEIPKPFELPKRIVDPRYAEIDALRDEHDEVSSQQSRAETNLYWARRAFANVHRQFATRDSAADLKAWVLDEAPDMNWAFQRLSVIDRPAAVALLETMLARDHANFDRVAALAWELTILAPERAQEIARSLPEDMRIFFPPATISAAGAGEKRALSTLLHIATDPKQTPAGRVAAIQELVPVAEPKRFPGEEVDETLLRLLTTKFANDYIQATLREAAIALARRDAARHWTALQQALGRLEIFDDAELLDSLALAAEQDREKFVPFFREFLTPQFHDAQSAVNDVVLLAWATDLRELKPQVESIATAGPEDYGGNHVLYGGARPVTQRYHLARIVAQFWNEEDAATRAKLLAAAGLQQAWLFDPESHPANFHRAELTLAADLAILPPAARASVQEFVDWLAAENKKSAPVLTAPPNPWLEMLHRQLAADPNH